VEPGTLVALFRNSHLSVLYKPVGENTSLYSLVTDHVFLHEASVVWERFEDIDGGWSTFVDSDFVKSSPAGGDFAGQTAEATLRAYEVEAGIVDPTEYGLAMLMWLLAHEVVYSRELAKHLQAEEDAHAYQIYLEQQRRSRNQQTAEAAGDNASRKHNRFKDKKDKCIIM